MSQSHTRTASDSDLVFPGPMARGLTKREYFAAMAMQGLLANLAALRKEGFHDKDLDQFAVMRADGLIATLSDEEQSHG